MNPRCFLDFSSGGDALGRVVFELYADKVPKTAENFRALCTGEKGVSPRSGVPLHYKGSIMHRIIDGFMCQGGDFTKKNGTGGESIYDGLPFEDEDLSGAIDQPGMLVMANKGPNTNGSQFFITLAPCPHLNGKHVLFGRVVGPSSMPVVERLAKCAVDGRDRPLTPVEISHCGELELRKKPAAAAVVTRKRSVSAGSGRSRSRSASASGSDSRSGSGSGSDSDAFSSADERARKKRRKLAKREKKDAKRAAKKARKAAKKGKSRDDGDDSKRARSRSRSASPATRLRRAEEQEELRRTQETDKLREEQAREERLEAKRRELERLKREDEEARSRRRSASEDGNGSEVVYKGRGAMKYRASGASGMRSGAW